MRDMYKAFVSRCSVHQKRIDELRSRRGSLDTWTMSRLTESLMSDIWQTWCLYCRNIAHISCRGSICLDGNAFSARISHPDNSWRRLGYEAQNRRNQNRITNNGHQTFLMRYEPTWGDLDVMLEIIQALAPVNQNTLSSAFGMGMVSLKHLQLARNACAHKNVETITQLSQQMKIHYQFNNLKEPSDLAWSFLRGTTTFAFYNWLLEMKTIARFASATL